MSIQLKNPNAGFPPCDHEGKRCGFYFSDPHTGMVFDQENSDLNHQAKLVAEHRKANPRIYSPDQPLYFDITAIKGEIVVQICGRNPQLCEDSALSAMPQPEPPVAPIPKVARASGRPDNAPCPKCKGLEFEPQICLSCGGSRVSGWKCLNCGYVV